MLAKARSKRMKRHRKVNDAEFQRFMAEVEIKEFGSTSRKAPPLSKSQKRA